MPKFAGFLILKIAARFLVSRSRGNFLSLVTGVSITGVCIGVFALLIVTSVINGYEHELSQVVSGTQGDLIFYSRGSPIRDSKPLEAKILNLAPEIQFVTRSLVSQVMFSSAQGVAGGMLEGVDEKRWHQVVRVEQKLLQGSRLPTEDGEVILGSVLAERLGMGLNDSLRITLPFAGVSSEGGYGAPRVQDFTVVGIVHIGMYDYDSKYAYALLKGVQNFVYSNGEDQDWITTLRMKVKEGEDPYSISKRLQPHFGFPYKLIDWSQLNKNLLYAIKLEKAVITVLLTAILLVAVFNVISALLMMVYEKEREIAILRVLGSRKRDQFILFAFLGSFFGFVGTGLGMMLGFFATLLMKKVRLIDLPPDIYHLEYLPILIRWTEWMTIGMFAFLICFLSTLGPAIQVSRRSPVEGLRWTT